MKPRLKRVLRTTLGREIFEKSAFSKGRGKGLTGKAEFEKKVKKIQAELKRHSEKNFIRTGKIGIPITVKQMAIATKDIARGFTFEKKLLMHPKTAALLAEKLKNTKDAKYFAKIARKAAKMAEKRKRKTDKKKQRNAIRKIAARKRAIQRADRQGAKKS